MPGTATRTISQPAATRRSTWARVASASCVLVVVMDWTTTGAPPPIGTPPTMIWREWRIAPMHPNRAAASVRRVGQPASRRPPRSVAASRTTAAHPSAAHMSVARVQSSPGQIGKSGHVRRQRPQQGHPGHAGHDRRGKRHARRGPTARAAPRGERDRGEQRGGALQQEQVPVRGQAVSPKASTHAAQVSERAARAPAPAPPCATTASAAAVDDRRGRLVHAPGRRRRPGGRSPLPWSGHISSRPGRDHRHEQHRRDTQAASTRRQGTARAA